MGRLIILSNRVALPNEKTQAGGLAVALEEALKAKGGLWCGWSGHVREDSKTHQQTVGNVEYRTMDLNAKDHADYYIGFANSVLWPLCHYRPDLMHFVPEQYAGYLRVSEQFAAMIAAEATVEDTVWVHDYHMIPIARMLRQAGVKSRIGFFLHIPFPAPETLSVLPVHRALLEELCEYDVIGFQTPGDTLAFARGVKELLGGTTNGLATGGMTHIRYKNRQCDAGCFPISIDTESMVAAAEDAERGMVSAQLKTSLQGRLLICGVDRMDYSKGLPARMDAIDALLTHYPVHAGRFSYTQITPTSRAEVEEYRDLRAEIEARVARVNGTYATISWSPIQFLTSSFSRNELAGVYRSARVGLVTPLRDGMNLVAKEYVASQNPMDPGVLVLSKFAGAAVELDAALLVNPFDVAGMADTLHQALSMPVYERRARYRAMMEKLRGNTIRDWKERFLTCLNRKENNLQISVTRTPLRAMETLRTARHRA